MTRSPLSRTAGMLCANPEFQFFLSHRFAAIWLQHSTVPEKERAAIVVREVCGIASRSELDKDKAAALRYHCRIGLPFSDWRREHARTPSISSATKPTHIAHGKTCLSAPHPPPPIHQ